MSGPASSKIESMMGDKRFNEAKNSESPTAIPKFHS
jgi:hypothetical protein